jgi:hypothetical protein
LIAELPNGLSLHAANASEARILYHEIFETDSYGKHGIVVRDGDCVFDVGANAGFYSVHLARARRGLRLYAFEPLPPVFALLEKNAAEHLRGVDAHLLPMGIGAKPERLRFRYDPQMSFASSAAVPSLEGSVQRDAGALAWARAIIEDGGRIGQIPAGLSRLLLRLLAIPGLNVITLILLGLVAVPLQVHRRLRTREMECEVRTLSQIIREHDIARIDLAKIDVEGAEWDVLQGIDDADWPRIRQLVIEVHDTDGRVARTARLLESRGFEVIVDREDWAIHRLLGIHTVYARRPAAAD